MKIVNTDVQLEISLVEETVDVLVVENPTIFSKLTGDIWKQLSGGEGSWILSDKEKELKIEKAVECIYNPFALDCNNRKVLNALYKRIVAVGTDEFFEETSKLNSEIIKYIEALLEKEIYCFDYSINLELSGLLKLYDVKIDIETGNLADDVVSYINVMHRICGIQVFIFMNMKQFFSENVLLEIYRNCLYEKINLLMIECVDRSAMKYERKIIIDQDSCIIMP